MRCSCRQLFNQARSLFSSFICPFPRLIFSSLFFPPIFPPVRRAYLVDKLSTRQQATGYPPKSICLSCSASRSAYRKQCRTNLALLSPKQPRACCCSSSERKGKEKGQVRARLPSIPWFGWPFHCTQTLVCAWGRRCTFYSKESVLRSKLLKKTRGNGQGYSLENTVHTDGRPGLLRQQTILDEEQRTEMALDGTTGCVAGFFFERALYNNSCSLLKSLMYT
jgi:hypothetical protein